MVSDTPKDLDPLDPHKLLHDTETRLLVHRHQVCERHHVGCNRHVPHDDPQIQLHLRAVDRDAHLISHVSQPITYDVATRPHLPT